MCDCPFNEIDPDDIVLQDDLHSIDTSNPEHEEAIEELRLELGYQIESSSQKHYWLQELEDRIEKLEEAISK